MVLFVALADAFENLNGLFDARLFDLDRLKTAFERRIGFDMLAIFFERGRADTLQFAASQSRLSRYSPRQRHEPAAPAPTTMCSSSINRMLLLPLISSMTRFIRSSN